MSRISFNDVGLCVCVFFYIDIHIVSSLSGRCTLTDLDIFWHMNNAIYLKHCDQARVKLWMYNGVWDIVFKAGGSMVVGACSNRYRRPLTLFQAYDLRSKVCRLQLKLLSLKLYFYTCFYFVSLLEYDNSAQIKQQRL